jgi:ferrous iron transport protein A
VLEYNFEIVLFIMLTTADLKTGFRVRLVDFGSTDAVYRRKLLSWGLTRGVDVNVVRVAPLGCPLQLDVRGASLAVRFDEARHIKWEPL